MNPDRIAHLPSQMPDEGVDCVVMFASASWRCRCSFAVREWRGEPDLAIYPGEGHGVGNFPALIDQLTRGLVRAVHV